MTDPSDLREDYRAAREKGRELVTLCLFIDQNGGDETGAALRGQIRQHLREATPLASWLLVEVLVRTVAAMFDDLDDWSTAVLATLAEDDPD